MNIEELIKSNANLEDYLNEYCESPYFIYNYYLQDQSRISRNYFTYSSFISDDDKIKLISKAIDSLDYGAINIIIKDLDNAYVANDSLKETINKVFNGLVELDKLGKIDINKITGSVFLYRSNPFYFVKKDPKNIKYCYNLKPESLFEILKYLVSINYTFKDDDRYFIDQTILLNPEILSFFINNCKYDISIDNYLVSSINNLSKEEMHSLFSAIENSNKTILLNGILNKLNYDNYDYKTIIKNRDLCLTFNDNNKQNILSLLDEINKNGFSSNIILIMNRINMDMVNEAYKLVGDNLKILPLANQMSENFDKYSDLSYRPYYDYDYIKKSEDKLNLYAKMVSDTKDKDGDIKSLSPLEKYIAAYILTSKFAPYKEVDGNSQGYESRSVYEFINSITNTKIVCVGYTHLLQEILYRMGIENTTNWSVNMNDKNHNDHSRMMIHLTDPKYGIDGIYMADPTFDNSKTTEKKFDHMLMSHDELTMIDKDVTNNMLRADEYSLMDSTLNVEDSYKLFHKPIPKEALVKAHLAVEHFLDKNMKMVNDNNYNILEYVEMANKLGYYDVYSENKDKIFRELEKMTINEIEYNYPALLDDFLYDLLEVFSSKIKENGVDVPLTGTIDHEENKILFGYNLLFNTEEFTDRNLTLDDINALKEIIPINRVSKKNGTAKFYIQMDNNIKINEQYEEITSKLCQLNDVITSNMENNRLK